jgi:hypothetical protein
MIDAQKRSEIYSPGEDRQFLLLTSVASEFVILNRFRGEDSVTSEPVSSRQGDEVLSLFICDVFSDRLATTF